MAARDRQEAGENAKAKKVIPPSPSLSYAAAGVDISAKSDMLERLKPLFRSTFSPQVAGDVGAFGGFFSARDLGCEDPVLVASTDSVGTKVRVAALAGKHKSIGWDIVAHCANDIVCQAARPLFFLDYFATAQLQPQVMEEVVEGLAECCRRAGCPLIGGETAELPDFYQPGDYDLVGFIVGVVDKKARITGENVRPGDVLLGLASDGLHTNGFSLARKLFFDIQGMKVDTAVPELDSTIGEALLSRHRLYTPALLPLMKEFDVRGIAHITGGGLPDNLPRTLPENCRAVVNKSTWSIPPIFQLISRLGKVSEKEMFHTFNMGIGMVVIVPAEQADDAARRLRGLGESPLVIGKVESGDRGVSIHS